MGRPASGYKLPDGTRVTGVTTILGHMKDSGPLMGWSFKTGLVLAMERIQGLVSSGSDLQHIDYDDLKPCWADRYKSRDDAATIGTCAHDAIELFIRRTMGEKVDDPSAAWQGQTEVIQTKASACFDSFLQWWELTRLVPVSMEEPMVSPMGYGGTPDLIARHPKGHLVIVDWKSSKGLYPEIPCQLAAYRNAWNETALPDVTEHGNRIREGHALRITKNGQTFEHRYYSEAVMDAGWAVFQDCLHLNNSVKALAEVA